MVSVASVLAVGYVISTAWTARSMRRTLREERTAVVELRASGVAYVSPTGVAEAPWSLVRKVSIRRFIATGRSRCLWIDTDGALVPNWSSSPMRRRIERSGLRLPLRRFDLSEPELIEAIRLLSGGRFFPSR
jgi:hypothetical protein